MEKGSANVRNPVYSSRLPPKIPVPAISRSCVEYVPSSSGYGSRVIEKGVEWNPYHQRTTSESFLIPEQPIWLDELLDEPETTVPNSIDVARVVNMGCLSQNDNRIQNITPFLPSWGCHDFDCFSMTQHAPFGIPPLASKGKEAARSATLVSKMLVEKKDSSHGKPSPPETARSAKQQYGQQSRVKKVQYIAELESNVQALEDGNSLAFGQLEFITNHNLIVGLENQTLQQLCESLAQQKHIKYLEQEILEREIIRLRALCQQKYRRSGHGRKLRP